MPCILWYRSNEKKAGLLRCNEGMMQWEPERQRNKGANMYRDYLDGMRLLLVQLELFHILDKSLFVDLFTSLAMLNPTIRQESTHQTSIFTIPKHTNIPQAQFHKTLKDQIHW
jgi:hypothetical protein